MTPDKLKTVLSECVGSHGRKSLDLGITTTLQSRFTWGQKQSLLDLVEKTLANPDCSLTHIELGFNDFGILRVVLVSLVSSHSRLTHLDLRHSNLDYYDFKELSVALQSESCRLTSLELSSYKLLAFIHIPEFAEAFRSEHCRLTHLVLHDEVNYLQMKDLADKFLRSLPSSLTHLSIVLGTMDADASKALAAAIRCLPCELKHIEFREERLGGRVFYSAKSGDGFYLALAEAVALRAIQGDGVIEVRFRSRCEHCHYKQFRNKVRAEIKKEYKQYYLRVSALMEGASRCGFHDQSMLQRIAMLVAYTGSRRLDVNLGYYTVARIQHFRQQIKAKLQELKAAINEGRSDPELKQQPLVNYWKYVSSLEQYHAIRILQNEQAVLDLLSVYLLDQSLTVRVVRLLMKQWAQENSWLKQMALTNPAILTALINDLPHFPWKMRSAVAVTVVDSSDISADLLLELRDVVDSTLAVSLLCHLFLHGDEERFAAFLLLIKEREGLEGKNLQNLLSVFDIYYRIKDLSIEYQESQKPIHQKKQKVCEHVMSELQSIVGAWEKEEPAAATALSALKGYLDGVRLDWRLCLLHNLKLSRLGQCVVDLQQCLKSGRVEVTALSVFNDDRAKSSLGGDADATPGDDKYCGGGGWGKPDPGTG